MLPRAIGQAALGLAFLLAGVGTATAGSFGVSPVRATLSASEPVGAVSVRNTGSEPVVVQLEVVSWSQEDGRDMYAETRDILATPPIFTIAPGGSQVVRVGLRRTPDPQRELAYRLFLHEVPQPPKPDFQGLQVALRLGVPVFVMPTTVAKPLLDWRVTHSTDGAAELVVVNRGNAHAQIAKFSLSLPDGTELDAQQVAAYVLSGHTRKWPVKDVVPLQPHINLQLSAQTDAGDIDTVVSVQP